MDEAKKIKVVDFLKKFKALMAVGGLNVVPRDKNNEALVDLGLTQRNRGDEILSLTPDNYHSGPEPDRDRPGDIWIFKKTVNGKRVYIKLKIADTGRVKIAKCLSFHVAEYNFS